MISVGCTTCGSAAARGRRGAPRPCRQEAAREVHSLPLQAEDLGLPHPGVERERDDRAQDPALRPLARREQPRDLVLGQEPQPALGFLEQRDRRRPVSKSWQTDFPKMPRHHRQPPSATAENRRNSQPHEIQPAPLREPDSDHGTAEGRLKAGVNQESTRSQPSP